MPKPISNFRLSAVATDLLKRLSVFLGKSMTAVLEEAIREYARKRKLPPKEGGEE